MTSPGLHIVTSAILYSRYTLCKEQLGSKMVKNWRRGLTQSSCLIHSYIYSIYACTVRMMGLFLLSKASLCEEYPHRGCMWKHAIINLTFTGLMPLGSQSRQRDVSNLHSHQFEVTFKPCVQSTLMSSVAEVCRKHLR